MKAIPRYETERMTILTLMSGGAKAAGTRAAPGRDPVNETARMTVPASVDRKDDGVRRSTAA
jgi:hypothetical protein